MEYTQEELDVINESLEVCKNDFEPQLSIEKDEDIIEALRTHREQHYMNKEKEQVAIGIYKRFGLWMDGRTTIEEHDHQELQKKLALTLRYKESQRKTLGRLKELKKAIDTSIQKIEEEPKKIMERSRERRQKLQSQTYTLLDEMRGKLNDHLRETATKLTGDYEKEKKLILNDLTESLELVKYNEKQEVMAIMEEYDELEKLKKEYLEIEQESKFELDRLDVKIEQAEANLFDLTVRELKEMASNKGIEYPQRILKADLVELIENNNDNEIIFEE